MTPIRSAHPLPRSAVVASLWRYPVKSMLGEELSASTISERGLAGDRAYALIDRSDGKVVSAKNPRKWPRMFEFRAALTDAPSALESPAVRITLPDGEVVTSDQPDVDDLSSRALGRAVVLRSVGEMADVVRTAEQYLPAIDGLEETERVSEFELPEGTFFDGAVVHLVTTATLARLSELYPPGQFDPRRFRPNLVVETGTDARGFVEQGWIGRTLAVGDSVRLRISRPCGRCVMTTLAQSELPADPGILRTLVRHHHGATGVYAAVARGGTVRRGDALRPA